MRFLILTVKKGNRRQCNDNDGCAQKIQSANGQYWRMLTIEDGDEVFPVDGEHGQPTVGDCYDNWIVDRRWIRHSQGQKSNISVCSLDLGSDVREGARRVRAEFYLRGLKRANRHAHDGIDRIRYAGKCDTI